MIGSEDFKRITRQANRDEDKDQWLADQGISVEDFDARAERMGIALTKRLASHTPFPVQTLFEAAFACGFELAWRLQDERYEGPEDEAAS